MFMATKLGNVITYSEELPSIRLYDPLVTWSGKVTSQTKYVISPLHSDYGRHTWQGNNMR